jgi:hypothetical protein
MNRDDDHPSTADSDIALLIVEINRTRACGNAMFAFRDGGAQTAEHSTGSGMALYGNHSVFHGRGIRGIGFVFQ